MKKDIVSEINKSAGKTIAFEGSDVDQNVTAMPTGILPLDAALGIGGLPKGRMIEIHGLQSTGKTALTLAIIAKFQKDGMTCAFVDAEYALNIQHAKSLGVDTDKLIVIQPDCGEEAFDAVEKLVRQKGAEFIVVDSVPALVPRGQIEAEIGKPSMASQARLMSAGLSRLAGPVKKNNATIVFISQMRMNIMGGQYDPYTVPGGMAMRFYTSIILELKREKAVSVGDNLIGYNIRIKVKKNKVGKPGTDCLVQLEFEGGFSAEADLLNLALDAGLIVRKGNTYFFGDTKLGIGENRAKESLAKNPETAEAVRAQLLQSPS